MFWKLENTAVKVRGERDDGVVMMPFFGGYRYIAVSSFLQR